MYNYNARLYDPSIAVFVTADFLVTDPGGSQGFNRYAYCINNPLIYTDPSGYEFLGIDIEIELGGILVAGILAAADWLLKWQMVDPISSLGDFVHHPFIISVSLSHWAVQLELLYGHYLC